MTTMSSFFGGGIREPIGLECGPKMEPEIRARFRGQERVTNGWVTLSSPRIVTRFSGSKTSPIFKRKNMFVWGGAENEEADDATDTKMQLDAEHP